MTDLTVASFFSGVGLLDLGLEWAGWRTVSFSEIDPYASRILALRYPDAPNLGDIHAITHVPPATLWAGGFPCQPVSVAGRKRAQDDERWLWPVWVGLIRQFRPRYLLLENVSNLLAVNDGAAFGDVLGDLAACGYDAEWDCLPASALGAPHRRDRVWIVAHAGDEPADSGTDVADSDGPRSAHRLPASWGGSRGDAEVPDHRGDGRSVRWAFAERRVEYHTGWWAAEPRLGRVAHGVPRRVDRLRCLGNGVVPQVAEFIGWRLRAMIEAQDLEAAA